MKAAARRIAITVALAALSTVSASTAHAHAPNDQGDVQPTTRPVEQTRDQQTLKRILAREHHAYPAALDQQTLAAQQTLARTLAREHHTYPTPNDPPPPANPQQAAQRRTLSTLGVFAMIAMLAMTWRRRARPRSQAAR